MRTGTREEAGRKAGNVIESEIREEPRKSKGPGRDGESKRIERLFPAGQLADLGVLITQATLIAVLMSDSSLTALRWLVEVSLSACGSGGAECTAQPETFINT